MKTSVSSTSVCPSATHTVPSAAKVSVFVTAPGQVTVSVQPGAP